MDVDDRGPLAELLRRQMTRRGYTADRLAKDADVPRATLHRWLSNPKTRPYFHDQALRLASTLQMTRAETNVLLRAAGLPLIAAIAAGAGAERRAALARWLAVARNNLPAPLTSFIGREDEVIELAARMCEEQPRLVTLTGPGGSGKTRLALRVADELLDAFPDGVFFVPLAAVRDPDDVSPAIVGALGLSDVAGRSPLERLGDYLSGRRCLLLLDNLEQVLAAGPAITTLLKRAPDVKALATSRVPLRVSGEHLWPVEPLPLPSPREAGATLTTAATQLFADRATAANPRFRLKPHAVAVAELCARLDGLPLAIELAAARGTRFAPDELLERFPNRLDVSADGPADVDERQQTLRAAIGWSFDLLPPAEQSLVTRLAVFEGGWTPEAAARVWGADGDIADGLTTLRDASLIAVAGTDGDIRFHMLETIREYMAERLAADPQAECVRDRHARFFLDLAEAQPTYQGTADTAALAALDAERDNLRTALRWLLDRDREAALRLAAALWPWWLDSGRFSEGLGWLAAALQPDIALPDKPRVRAEAGRMVLLTWVGRYADALALADATAARAVALGDPASAAIVEVHHAIIVQHGGDLAAGQALYRRALEHWRAAGLPLGEARCLSDLALLEAMRGAWDAFAARAAAAEAIYERENYALGLARSLTDRGLAALLSGDLPSAIALLAEADARADVSALSVVQRNTRCYLGIARLFAGQHDAARANLVEALRAYNASGDPLFISYCLFGLAGAAGGLGDPRRAAALCGAAFATQATFGLVMPPAIHRLYTLGEAAIRARMSAEAFDAAFARGQELTTAEAVAYALEMADGHRAGG